MAKDTWTMIRRLAIRCSAAGRPTGAAMLRYNRVTRTRALMRRSVVRDLQAGLGQTGPAF